MIRYPSYCAVIFPGAVGEHFSGNGYTSRSGSDRFYQAWKALLQICGRLRAFNWYQEPRKDVNPQETQVGFD